MFKSKKDSHRRSAHRPGTDQKRFYLLPGMGGRAYRRKRDLILKASIAVGLTVSGLFALLMWLLHRTPK